MFESDFLTSADVSQDSYRRLISRATAILCESLPVLPYVGKSPEELADLTSGDFFPRTGSPQIPESVRTVIRNSISVSHPHTAAHLHCPPLLASLAAEVIISALNQSMDSFDQAPIATIIEQKMIRWLCTEAGFPSSADGTFTTGGSQSNYMGLLLARDACLLRHWNWSGQKSGLPPDAARLRILCSEVAHFSVEKSAAQLGLGTDSVVRIRVDDRFRMAPSALHETLAALRTHNLIPMAIVATAGTTDFGSIDPLTDLADLAASTHTWLHIDAAYGGALLFSSQLRSQLAGIERAHSIAIDFHKLLWQPIPCSVFLLRDSRLFDPIRMHSDYLNPEAHDAAGIPNLVTTSLLTSRRFDALKLWISFQALGRDKLAAMIGRTVALAHNTATIVRNARQLELLCEPELTTVIFRYLPDRGDLDADDINARIRQTLFERGVAVIGHTRVHQRQCLKFTCMNPAATGAQMESLIGEILAIGKEFENGGRRP